MLKKGIALTDADLEVFRHVRKVISIAMDNDNNHQIKGGKNDALITVEQLLTYKRVKKLISSAELSDNEPIKPLKEKKKKAAAAPMYHQKEATNSLNLLKTIMMNLGIFDKNALKFTTFSEDGRITKTCYDDVRILVKKYIASNNLVKEDHIIIDKALGTILGKDNIDALIKEKRITSEIKGGYCLVRDKKAITPIVSALFYGNNEVKPDAEADKNDRLEEIKKDDE